MTGTELGVAAYATDSCGHLSGKQYVAQDGRCLIIIRTGSFNMMSPDSGNTGDVGVGVGVGGGALVPT